MSAGLSLALFEGETFVVSTPSLSSISTCLWELRAKCEQQVRWLGDAQVMVDLMRDHPEHDRAALAERVTSRLDQLQDAARAVTEGVKECLGQVNGLHD